jgi:succinate dehydrogenase flavin-adding protein (antitoxin of CptAB toxin-antitoxin module)
VAQFRELLALPDNDLLDLIMERGPLADRRFETLLKLLRTP